MLSQLKTCGTTWWFIITFMGPYLILTLGLISFLIQKKKRFNKLKTCLISFQDTLKKLHLATLAWLINFSWLFYENSILLLTCLPLNPEEWIKSWRMNDLISHSNLNLILIGWYARAWKFHEHRELARFIKLLWETLLIIWMNTSFSFPFCNIWPQLLST